tara:strand:+ start:320 stop:775 length:456 start_codon:yes stop_codon:yes gene_type:complete
MKIKLLIVILLILLNGCGYSSIYNSKDSSYNISDIATLNNNKLLNLLRNKILVTSNEDALRIIKIELDLKEDINVILKDKKGNPSKNRISISVNLKVLEGDSIIVKQNFSKNFEYNVASNKSNMFEYENNIKKNLITDISQDITFLLATIK